MTNATKRTAILFLILTALITVLLAAALPQLELQPGVPLPRGESQSDGSGGGGVSPGLAVSVNTFLATIAVLIVISLIVYIISRRGRGLNWRSLLRALVYIAAFSAILALLLYWFSNVRVQMIPQAIEILPVEIAVVTGPALAPVPQTLLWVIWLALAVMVVLLGIGVSRVRISRKTRRDPLAVEAEQAVEALKAGQSFSNVILRCYEQMSLVLKKEQGLTLEETMTAREFESLLEKRGVPDAPVRQLTRLFEIARYAAQSPGPAEEAQAIECLNAIAQYSQNKGPRKSR